LWRSQTKLSFTYRQQERQSGGTGVTFTVPHSYMVFLMRWKPQDRHPLEEGSIWCAVFNLPHLAILIFSLIERVSIRLDRVRFLTMKGAAGDRWPVFNSALCGSLISVMLPLFRDT
jgi:hypothetical protein